MKKASISVILFLIGFNTFSQDSALIRRIYTEALTNKVAYQNLSILTKSYSKRLCGSSQAAGAVEWSRKLMLGMGFDTVYLQEVSVPKWERGEKEICKIISPASESAELSVCALGTAIGTGPQGISARVVEVRNFEELKMLGNKVIAGKIVFFNRPADPTFYYTFNSYGSAADQRVHGASEAAKYGAIGVIVRSLTLADDDFPHTGIMRYDSGITRIPAIAVSTLGADILSRKLKNSPGLTLFFRTTCSFHDPVISYNVIGELRGTEKPDEIITVGGHLDCWDNSDGAHDDACGCMQSIEVLRIFKTLGIKPKRTLRAVMYMDEEIAQSGGRRYAELAEINKEKHFFAFESDRGCFTPTDFAMDATPEAFRNIEKFKSFFIPYGEMGIKPDGHGVDIAPLKKFNIPLIVLVTDSQRYFDLHHAASDTIDKVNPREMQLGSASMAALIYLIDKYGY